VLFTVFGPPTGPDIRMLQITPSAGPKSPTAGESARRGEQAVLETPRHERSAVVSPDGEWMAYESDTAGAPGQMNVYVRRFPVQQDGGVWQVSADRGTHPLWSRKGEELFYLAGDGAMMAVPVTTSGDLWVRVKPQSSSTDPTTFAPPTTAGTMTLPPTAVAS
jgi:hypothetical protein